MGRGRKSRRFASLCRSRGGRSYALHVHDAPLRICFGFFLLASFNNLWKNRPSTPTTNEELVFFVGGATGLFR